MPTTVVLVLALLAAGALYLLACRIWPFGPCFRCKGAGKFHPPGGRSFRRCPRCKGSGMRQRFGTQVLNRGRDNRSKL